MTSDQDKPSTSSRKRASQPEPEPVVEETVVEEKEAAPLYSVARYQEEADKFGIPAYIIAGAATHNGWGPDDEMTVDALKDGIKTWLASPVTNE